jgi:hypothetical protein
MKTSRLVALALAVLALCLALASVAPARAALPLGFFFINQMLDGLAGRAFGALGQRLPQSPPSWPVTLGAAELINDKLPLESADGFVILMARAPAPAALEIKATAPGSTPPTSEQLDAAWGPGLIHMFCGDQSSLWTRWVAIGGSVGLEVRGADGSLVRRYGVSKADCQALAGR